LIKTGHKLNISILYGGASTEHNISIQTGLAIAEAIKDRYNLDMINLDSEIYNAPQLLVGSDLVFNALHGGDGENGSIQSFLDLHHIPYTGSGAKPCKIAMDKNITKLIAKSVDIQTPNWILLKRNQHTGMQLHDNQPSKFSYPYVVKPSSEGSTFGLTIVKEESELKEAISHASEYGDEILIEEFIPGRELTVGILGNKPLPVVEIKPSHDLYDYECKYTEGMSEYFVPAELSDSLERSLSEDALKIYKTIGCRHYARVDFRLNEAGEHYLLEINTLPGMTSTSLLPKAAKAAGLEFPDLIDTIIKIASMD
jgi:D-alanine-D-alanine ligase